jgi:SAM-dependent methyltransferase
MKGEFMKQIPELPKVDIEPLYEIAQGGEKFILLTTAVDFNVFEFFAEPATAREFIDKAGTDRRLTEKFLNALVAAGLLTKENSKYGNTPLASTYLMKGEPFYQGNLLGLMSRTRQERWANLGRCLKEGPLQPDKDLKQVFDKNFIVAMAQGAMRGGLHRTVEIVSALPEFSGSKNLLDLGGGHGLYAIAFAQANPKLESVVFDLPPVMEAAKAYIDEYEMQDRVRAVAGDFTKDDWGNGYDIVFASDCLYKPREDLMPVLQKIKSSLNPGGIFISKHWMMDSDRTSPDTTVFFDLMISLIGTFSGHTHSRQEAAEVFADAGFAVESMDMSTPSKPSMLFICRKGEQ